MGGLEGGVSPGSGDPEPESVGVLPWGSTPEKGAPGPGRDTGAGGKADHRPAEGATGLDKLIPNDYQQEVPQG